MLTSDPVDPEPQPLWMSLALAAVAYLATTTFTTWLFVGDAPDYAHSIISQLSRGDCNFLEFGHLLWRATGYVALKATSPQLDATSPDGWLHALHVLDALSLTAGLVTVLALTAWLRTVTRSVYATLAAVAFVIVNKSFLNYSQAGTSYVTALCFLSLTLWLGCTDQRTRTRQIFVAILNGCLLALSMLYWAPFVFVAPGALLAPLLLRLDWKPRIAPVAITAAVCALSMLVTYAWVGSVIGLHTLADYRAWIADAQHGITFGGPARAAIGLARFVVDLGNFGASVKRYVLHDPYATVKLSQLLSVDLLKMLVVYIFATSCAVLAWRAGGGWKRMAFFALSLGPILVFGIFWQGGDLERFLPALPAFALFVAQAYVGSRGLRWATAGMITVIVFVAIINSTAMSAFRVQREQQNTSERLAGLPADALTKDVLIVSHWHDPLMEAMRNDPFDERVRAGLSLYPLITTGMPRVPMWREDFASEVTRAWGDGRSVWISNRILAQKPNPTWAWTEGDDSRIRWKDFPTYFDSLTYDRSRSSNRDFLFLPDTPANRARLLPPSPLAGTLATVQAAPACHTIKLFSGRN